MNRREVFTALAIAPLSTAAIAKTVVDGNYVVPVQENLCRWMGQDLPLREAVRRMTAGEYIHHMELIRDRDFLRQQKIAHDDSQECFGG